MDKKIKPITPPVKTADAFKKIIYEREQFFKDKLLDTRNSELNNESYPDEILIKNNIDHKKMNLEQHKRWYRDQVLKQWKYKFQSINVDTMVRNPDYGIMSRYYGLSQLKYRTTYNTMDMIVVVLKVFDYYTNLESNYGMLFVELFRDIGTLRQTHYTEHTRNGNVTFTYYCASPSYISMDGEYRNRFGRYHDLFYATKIIYPELWQDLEEYVSRIKTRRRWILNKVYFYPKLDQANKKEEIENAVRDSFVGDNIFIVAWFHAIYNALAGVTEIHINESFKSIFLDKYLQEDLNYLKSRMKIYSPEILDKFRSDVTFYPKLNLQQVSPYIQCGFKMIPLNVKEVQEPMIIKYKPWREFYVCNALNDLVINSIAPGFSIMLDWFYIKNSRKGLFDNKAQYDRMKSSEIAIDILHTLYEAQRGTYSINNEIPDSIKTDKEIRHWILNNNKFKKLYHKIDEPINYSLEEIIMSEVTLGFVSEFVGRTVADTMDLVCKSKYYDEKLGSPLKESGYNYFAKYIFEICYNMYCMNSKLGIIHGDLHLNNATIGSLQHPIYKDTNKNHKVVYCVDEKTYVFPNNGIFGCIIDFSRAILNPNTIEKIYDKSRPDQKFINNIDKFRNTELESLITLYRGYFPNKDKQKEELIVLAKNHTNVVFKLLTAIEIWLFASKLIRYLGTIEAQVSKSAIGLLDKIVQLSYKFLSVDMDNLVNDPNMAKQYESDSYPLLTIIHKCFPEYVDGQTFLKDKNGLGDITDMYCYDNPIKYSLSNYDNYPDFLKYVRWYKDENTTEYVEGENINKIRRDESKEYMEERKKNDQMVYYIANRHKEKLF